MRRYYQGELKDDLLPLLFIWARWREGRSSCRGLQAGYVCIRHAPYDPQPEFIQTTRGTGPQRASRSEVVNQCVMDLPEWKQEIIQVYVTLPNNEEGNSAWKELKRDWGLSERKWQSILLDLQELCEIRGLL